MSGTQNADKPIRCSACLTSFPTFTALSEHVRLVVGQDALHPLPPRSNRGDLFSNSVLRRRAIQNGEQSS